MSHMIKIYVTWSVKSLWQCHTIRVFERVIKVKIGTANDWSPQSNLWKLGIHGHRFRISVEQTNRIWSVDPLWKSCQWKKITKMKWSNLMGFKSWVHSWPMVALNRTCFGPYEIFLIRTGLIFDSTVTWGNSTNVWTYILLQKNLKILKNYKIQSGQSR